MSKLINKKALKKNKREEQDWDDSQAKWEVNYYKLKTQETWNAKCDKWVAQFDTEFPPVSSKYETTS